MFCVLMIYSHGQAREGNAIEQFCIKNVFVREMGRKDASRSGSETAVNLRGKCEENVFFKHSPCITTCKDNETQKAWLPVFKNITSYF